MSASSTDALRAIAREQGLQAGIDSIAGIYDPRDLLALRLGFSEFLLARVIAHLRSRATGESTILMQQLVKAQLADIAIEHLEIDARLSVLPLSLEAVAQLDRRITDTDRAILRLFGGWGYLRGEESDGADLSERLLGTSSRSAEGARRG